ncbi:MAG: (2Fe-2S)-binding protein [Planctomycetes bacterium]|nr:(2Fe-2S)-binding protein [Planctomycetota bacterium]
MSLPFTPDPCDGCADRIICRCLQVSESQVIRMITRLELRTVHDLTKYTGAGDGCTCCHAKLAEYLEKFSCEAAALG